MKSGDSHLFLPSSPCPPWFLLRALRGLFLGFVVVCLAVGLWADEDEPVEYEPIEVRMETNPANPTVNNPWSVFILVNHPRPDEVSVDSSDFPSSLVLERIRTDTRTVSPGTSSQTERWTRVEFLFIPRRAETVSLPPFEVRISERLAMTDAISVRVQGESSNRYEPRFRWLAPPAGLRIGETGEITLELTNWDPARRIPEDFFQGRAPVNAILEGNPPVRAGEAYRYRIVLIPLDGGSVKLEAFTFYSDTYTLSVPEISLPILGSREISAASAAVPEPHAASENPVDSSRALPLPSEREGLFFLWRRNEIPINFISREYQQIIDRVEALWGESRWAEALAEIRKNERDSLAGPYLVSLRREMEGALGLSVTDDERWQPLGIPLFSSVIVFLVLVFAGVFLIVLWGKNVTSRRRYGFIFVIVCTFILGLVFILPAANSVRSPGIAVLKRTQSYRIPDYKGAANDWFSGGQPVTVGDFRGEWCFVETLDGRSGWVERESVINY